LYTLKSNVDSFQIVSSFATDKLIPKRTYNSSFQSIINLMFDPDEIKSLNKITNDNININYSLFRQQYEIEKPIDINMNFDVSRIYVFQNETDKIFVIKGIYYFYVYNYSEEPELQRSSAKVDVYIGSDLVTTINVPTSEKDGLSWKVCSYNSVTGTFVHSHKEQLFFRR
jgi:hypothetical protein